MFTVACPVAIAMFTVACPAVAAIFTMACPAVAAMFTVACPAVAAMFTGQDCRHLLTLAEAVDSLMNLLTLIAFADVDQSDEVAKAVDT